MSTRTLLGHPPDALNDPMARRTVIDIDALDSTGIGCDVVDELEPPLLGFLELGEDSLLAMEYLVMPMLGNSQMQHLVIQQSQQNGSPSRAQGIRVNRNHGRLNDLPVFVSLRWSCPTETTV